MAPTRCNAFAAPETPHLSLIFLASAHLDTIFMYLRGRSFRRKVSATTPDHIELEAPRRRRAHHSAQDTHANTLATMVMFAVSASQFDLVYNSLSFTFASMLASTLFFWLRLPSVSEQYKSALTIT
eukprot:6184867-Pleurochrysis_carterae.AAC.2